MVLDNDTRGWIMTCISAIACICGAGIICVDVVVRKVPGYHDFEVTKSDTFLSASLSLSFGVMLFSSLYSMLPNSKRYLVAGGFTSREAAWLLIGLFLGGVVGVQVLSRFLHHYIPTHVVDCGHHHDEEEPDDGFEEMEEQPNQGDGSKVAFRFGREDEETPLLSQDSGRKRGHPEPDADTWQDVPRDHLSANGFVSSLPSPGSRRPSVIPRSISRTWTKIASPKLVCDKSGPCKGYSDPCGHACFRANSRRASVAHRPSGFGVSIPSAVDETFEQPSPLSHTLSASDPSLSHSSTHLHPNEDATPTDHHHHVATNTFLSIGLQTSLAIALHKAPEGFITYATNHANPRLGLAVFMALFIHNISEGFAMALPLYLALQSRGRAIAWSSLLGGASQPLGAAVAALWFHLARGDGDHGGETGTGEPSDKVYGCMFAVTAGVMASVALQLFAESLGLQRARKGVCVAWAVVGMGVLGVSSALTA